MAGGKNVLELPLFTVDAFTDVQFAGNSAAVCLNECGEKLGEDSMQKLATEMNISETAFVSLLNEKDNFHTASKFGLRWFTPSKEVPLCGHATLASAAVLFNCLDNQSQSLSFQTLSGDLITRREDNLIVLDLPQSLKIVKPVYAEMEKLIQVTTFDLPIQDVVLAVDRAKLLIRLDDSVTRQQLEDLSPKIDMMESAHNTGTVKGVIVTVKGSKETGAMDALGNTYDFLSRYFAPWNGIPEDPVTGSAHTVLGPYWAEVLDKTNMYARQCSKRGGDLFVKMVGNGRVDVAGNSAVVVRGTVTIPVK